MLDRASPAPSNRCGLDSEPDGFAGVVGIDAESKLPGALALESTSSSELGKLVRYARERLK